MIRSVDVSTSWTSTGASRRSPEQSRLGAHRPGRRLGQVAEIEVDHDDVLHRRWRRSGLRRRPRPRAPPSRPASCRPGCAGPASPPPRPHPRPGRRPRCPPPRGAGVTACPPPEQPGRVLGGDQWLRRVVRAPPHPGEAGDAGGHGCTEVARDLDRAGDRTATSPHHRSRRVDPGGCRDRPHAHRHVGGEHPDVGIVVDGDARRRVDGEGQHARPDDAVVQRLRLRPELEAQLAVLDARPRPRRVGTEDSGMGMSVNGSSGLAGRTGARRWCAWVPA